MDASSKYQDSLPVSSDALLARLDGWGIPYELHHHVPLKTVEDAKGVEDDIIPAGKSVFRLKNLYLRDRKKRNYLASVEQDRDVDLKALGEMMGAGRLSFGSADRLMEFLGVRPGAVTPLAMVNGVDSGVTFFMDAAARDADLIFMHPLVNDRTVALTPADFDKALQHLGVAVTWLDF